MKINTVVIGAGPGGYVAAIRLAQLGIETLVVEKEYFGGVCLNVGCIPSKALIHAAKTYYKTLNENSSMGIITEGVSLDFPKVISWKDSVVKKLTTGIRGLLKGNKVQILEGTAEFSSKKSLLVHQERRQYRNCRV